MPLIDCSERLDARDIVDEKGTNAPAEEKRCQRVELFLTKSVPDVRLDPIVGAFDIEAGHGHDLTDTCWHLVLLIFVKDASIGQRCLANAAITH